MQEISIWWLRRDLRLEDNAALLHALKAGRPVLPVFIFDRNILDRLSKPMDARVHFIHQQLEYLKQKLETRGSTLKVFYGYPESVWEEIISNHLVKAVFTNRDYEPYAQLRDEAIEKFLKEKGIAFYTFKDQVVYEMNDLLKADGTPYVVYTPFMKAWRSKLAEDEKIPFYDTESHFHQFLKTDKAEMPTLPQMGFAKTALAFPPASVSSGLIKNYAETRDFPAINGTSRLSLHYRFGTISPRQKTASALYTSEKYANEMIWREFYMYILAHFPHVVGNSFRKEYDRIEWLNNAEDFEKWKNGKTGIPLVDAGMRELNATGYMHNRVRMVVASFLTKNLLIDWRWGEAYFADKLLDFELASNNGGWQWAAGCGVDAAPYFRVFNPELQREKFDPKGEYTKKWVPEFGTPAYPTPMVDLKATRDRAIAVYQKALKE